MFSNTALSLVSSHRVSTSWIYLKSRDTFFIDLIEQKLSEERSEEDFADVVKLLQSCMSTLEDKAPLPQHDVVSK